MSQTNVAICLYGYPYFYRKSYDDINNLINILKDQGVNIIDVYIHLWGDANDVGKMFKRTWERVREGDRVIKPRVKEWLTNKYKPKQIINNSIEKLYTLQEENKEMDGWTQSLELVKQMIPGKYDYFIFMPINTCFNDNIKQFKLQTGKFTRPHILPAYISDTLEIPENQLPNIHGIYFAKM